MYEPRKEKMVFGDVSITVREQLAFDVLNARFIMHILHSATGGEIGGVQYYFASEFTRFLTRVTDCTGTDIPFDLVARGWVSDKHYADIVKVWDALQLNPQFANLFTEFDRIERGFEEAIDNSPKSES